MAFLTVRILFRVSTSDVETDDRYLDREVIPEARKDEFMLVRPSLAFLIQRTTGNKTYESH